jgi:hypothetical protein
MGRIRPALHDAAPRASPLRTFRYCAIAWCGASLALVEIGHRPF